MNARVRFCVDEQRSRGGGAGAVGSGAAVAPRACGRPMPSLAQCPPPAARRRDCSSDTLVNHEILHHVQNHICDP